MLINGIEVTRALIIRKPWIHLILAGLKVWEMRSTKTKIRGTIALIEQGTGLIVGLANLTDSLEPLSHAELMANFDKHKVDYDAMPELAKWRCPWVLENVQRIEPIPYEHKVGAVIWVNI
ncbi:ASCH domain-containing protein [Vibrio alginolyticus]|uniref:ASCH domain-containing protein n=1 Tax=Vibrio TaxID=662 RepID=UPI0005F22B4F|nr:MULTISPECIES: ASCH domain-containing protein [Vibrio]EGQ7681805.1 ASCH domain-containing protein [Vibrio parahaemolyticus]EGR3207703.1 ASCH domain-containing protein [Vibrio parahaemolyticus]EHH3659083.1 ASCH domain-containing protein [Vibrio parahaemolyticus]EID0732743.1 ASCH domain-containing protein [Vibrio parahaemolyticus]EID7761479.1 ASCH domain-containing protein [Vibrio parahaemolyticus]